jgi:hypothetical protein
MKSDDLQGIHPMSRPGGHRRLSERAGLFRGADEYE